MRLASTDPKRRAIAARAVARVILAGPVAVGVSLLVLAAMPLWMPPGAAGIDHIVLPLLALPGIWAALFFHAVLDRRLARVAVVALALAGLNAALLARHAAAPPIPHPGEVVP